MKESTIRVLIKWEERRKTFRKHFSMSNLNFKEMMISYTNTISHEIDLSIVSIRNQSMSDVCKLRELISIFEGVFEKLRRFIREYDFKNDAEEILFFKEIKPNLFSKLIYYQKIYKLIIERPPGGEEEQKKYLNNEVRYLFLFFEKHKEFYHYYRSGETNLDRCYYLRKSAETEHISFESFYYERDPLFSTPYDFKLAKLKANEEYEKLLLKEMEKYSNEYYANGISSFLKMAWTGTKVELIALTYSLHNSKRINNGQSSLDEFKRKVEIIFNIDLGNMSANLRDMSQKKNPAQFLDILKKCFNVLIDKHLK